LHQLEVKGLKGCVHLEGSPERKLAWGAAFTPLQRSQARRPALGR
jgi:hypothetical protein